ncbi:MAG: NAD(P)-binding domain-containing protein [Pseudomonadales bacterium]|nr:NAD(P)/FAD-dependent oxidoreductase [Pseudomonadales bacterium]NIX09159.1 NAD(P)-binding domain-containing protein [Pseudomonadales bacterium]
MANRQPRIAIIGAGMSGIAAVVKLRKAGYTDVTVYEKADRVGGTWRENTYPGLSCDVPSRWYSFSFALNSDWTHRFSYGPEIQAYMEKVADDFDVTSVVRFDTAVTELNYEAPLWRLTTATGEQRIYDVVISATGILHHPATPDIEGLDDFAGECFHSARWDHSVTLTGKRVGVIGTGSTAAQIVGDIAADVGELHVFQRTPQWMVPMPQKTYSPRWKRTLKLFPFLNRLAYQYYFRLMVRTFAMATVGDAKMQARISEVAQRNLERNVKDPELRRRLTPDYQAACKRLILCSDFYPAISRDNAHLVTDAIERITPSGVQTEDGRVHELDVLVLATGFDPSAFILPTKVTGEGGVDLESFWQGAPRALRAVAIPGFPNFWMLEGPTGPVGNMSLITITEHQVDYVIRMLDRMKRRHLVAMTAREEAYRDYNSAMQEAVKDTVWMTGGCTSWYIDKTGIPNLYPWEPTRYLKSMRKPDFSEYREDAGEKPAETMAAASALSARSPRAA